MIFEDEHWKLVITPRFIRKDNTMVKIECYQCKGNGRYFEDDGMCHGIGDRSVFCSRCNGNGYTEELSDIPPPPEIDKNFLKDLKEWYRSYVPKEESS